MSTPIEIMMNEDGSFTIPELHITPYVAPVEEPPPPVEEPPPTTTPTWKLVLSVDKDVIKVGDQFMLTAIRQYDDGTTAPVNAYRIYGFDSTIVKKIDPVSDSQRTFIAVAVGTTKIKTDFNGKTGSIAITVLEADSIPISPPPPPVEEPPPPVSPPPPPPPATDTATDAPSVLADGQSILYHYPMDVTLAEQVDYVQIPGTFGESPQLVFNIKWDFGDGTNGFGADGRHPYDKPGTYQVSGVVNYKDGHTLPFGPISVTV